MASGDDSSQSGAPPRGSFGRIPSDPPPGLPKHTPVRRPRAWRSRFRRWVQRTTPKVWTFVTGNTDARRGKPLITALYIMLVLVVLGFTALTVLLDPGPPQ